MERFKQHNPDHRVYWDTIAAEIHYRYGANTFATILRGGEGVLYKEVLINACNKVNFNKKCISRNN